MPSMDDMYSGGVAWGESPHAVMQMKSGLREHHSAPHGFMVWMVEPPGGDIQVTCTCSGRVVFWRAPTGCSTIHTIYEATGGTVSQQMPSTGSQMSLVRKVDQSGESLV